MDLNLNRARNKKELQHEKELLLQEKKRLEEEGFFSLSDLVGGNDSKEGAAGSTLGKLPLKLIAMASPILGLVSEIVIRRVAGGGQSVVGNAIKGTLKAGGKALGGTAKELIGGYLKWKAAELSYKGLTLVIKRRKRKQAERAAKEAADLQDNN